MISSREEKEKYIYANCECEMGEYFFDDELQYYSDKEINELYEKCKMKKQI